MSSLVVNEKWDSTLLLPPEDQQVDRRHGPIDAAWRVDAAAVDCRDSGEPVALADELRHAVVEPGIGGRKHRHAESRDADQDEVRQIGENRGERLFLSATRAGIAAE